MDSFEVEDLRSFCLCRLSEHKNYCYQLKSNLYIPRHVRVYFWKLLKYRLMLLKDEENKGINESIDDLYNNKLNSEEKEKILGFVPQIYNHLKKYSYNNSKVYDKLTKEGFIIDNVSKSLLHAGAHSFVSYITPITEKIWVNGELTFDEFIERLPENLKDRDFWDFTSCPPIGRDE